MNIFDILGPVMVGPSSSHTAGAVRIGLVTKKLLGAVPVKAVITLSGSFSATGVGHGTDRALVAGLLGMKPDNICIPEKRRNGVLVYPREYQGSASQHRPFGSLGQYRKDCGGSGLLFRRRENYGE